MRKSFQTMALALSVAGACGAVAARDVRGTADLTVKINISSGCSIQTVTTTDVDFGRIAALTNVSSVAGGFVRLACTDGSPYEISIGDGEHFASTRRMKNLATQDFLPYDLYRDAARLLPWGSTTGVDTVVGVGTGTLVSIPVYGKVPASNVPQGDYQDRVRATLYY